MVEAVGFGVLVMVLAAGVILLKRRIGLTPMAFGIGAIAFVGLLVFVVYRRWGLFDGIAVVFGLLLGALTLPAMGTPFVPSPPRLGGVQALFMRVYFTISSMDLGPNVLFKKANGAYTRVRATVDGDEVRFTVDGVEHVFEGASHRLVQFGKRPLGLAWSKDHPLYQRIKQDKDVTTDGGQPAELVDMGKLHRLLRGAADHAAINEAVKEARNEHGGGDQGLSQTVLMVAIVVMLLLGFATGLVAG